MDGIFRWNDLPQAMPEPLLEGLLQGTVGKMQLFGLARQALESSSTAGDADLASLGVQLLRMAWESDLLDGGMASQLLAVAGELLPAPLRQTITAVAEHFVQPERLDYLMRLLAKNDAETLRSYLQEQCRKEPENLFWLQQALGRAVYEGDWAHATGLLDNARAPELAAVIEKVRADLNLFAGAPDLAAEQYGVLARGPGLWSASLGQAAALRQMGRDHDACSIWKGAMQVMPWNVSLLLRLHDALTGMEQARAALPAKVAVLLYTYNKAEELERSLAALADALPDNATLFALDNGSSDATPEVLAGWSARLGARMRVVTLPVNVGAPAARNWLAQMDEVRSCDWLAYVDDDAPVPQGWLERLGAAVQAYPQASVWGCKVVDAANPALLQHVDLHLCDPRETPQDPDAPQYRRRFSLSRLQHQVLDWGQFDYCRPCASVTGCVHLLRRETLERSGGFDLRFTPSQFDDLEHDLRLGLAGEEVIYQGHLRVLHHKRTGRAGRGDHRENARSLANQYKLQQLYGDEELSELRQRLCQRLLADVRHKWSQVKAYDGK